MISTIYIAISAIMSVFLSIQVIKARRKNSIALGDGGHNDLIKTIRAQGNFIEYTPLFMIMLFAAEYQGLPYYAIHGFGIIFIAGRISHAFGLIKAEKFHEDKEPEGLKFRISGMMITFASYILLALTILAQHIF